MGVFPQDFKMTEDDKHSETESADKTNFWPSLFVDNNNKMPQKKSDTSYTVQKA